MDGQAVERAAVEVAVELLVAAARSEVSQKRMIALEEPTAFDIQKYSADHHLTCYLSTPSGVWLVLVTESDYPAVIEAWRRIPAVERLSGSSLNERTLVTTLQVAQAQAAEILLVPYPLGIPAVAYAFELQPTSDQPICAQVAGENWLHTDPGGLGPVQRAWSYRAIVSQEESSSDWAISLGEGRVPDQWAIHFTVQR